MACRSQWTLLSQFGLPPNLRNITLQCWFPCRSLKLGGSPWFVRKPHWHEISNRSQFIIPAAHRCAVRCTIFRDERHFCCMCNSVTTVSGPKHCFVVGDLLIRQVLGSLQLWLPYGFVCQNSCQNTFVFSGAKNNHLPRIPELVAGFKPDTWVNHEQSNYPMVDY